VREPFRVASPGVLLARTILLGATHVVTLGRWSTGDGLGLMALVVDAV
jgi:hypothetical protein